MIKEILAVLKTVAICTGGVLALIGLRYFATTIRTLTSPLHVLIQILVGVILLVGAIAVFCQWYLRNEPKKIKRYKCLLCGRDKFTKKEPHNCNNGFRKRHIIWEEIE